MSWDLEDQRGQEPSATRVPLGRDDPPDAGPRPGTKFRPDIEGLRAVAIVLVVLYHAGVRRLSGGYVGVDVFFVISGFLITSHLAGEALSTGSLNVGRFYGRRILRLIPAATLVLATTLIASWLWLPATRLRSIAWDAIAANGYALNYRLAAAGTDYRNLNAAPSPLQHFWSLAVEEQFYLLIPLLLVLTVVVARSRRAFAAAVAGITAASLAWSILTSGSSPIWAYFGAPARAWELGAGALLALAAPTLVRIIPGSSEPDDTPIVPLLMAAGGLVAIGYAAIHFNERTVFPGYEALVPVLGAALVIAGGTVALTPGLGAPLLRSIGARSYSWYLWHWPVLVIAPYVIKHDLTLTDRLIAVAVAYGLACLSYALLEQPLRTNPGLRDHPGRAVVTGLGLTAAVVTGALVLPTVPAHVVQGIGHAQPVRLTGSTSARTKALTRRLTSAASVRTMPKNLTPSLKKAATDDPIIAHDGCLLGYTQTRTPTSCERFGDTRSRTVVALFGDSHAAQWFPALETIADERHFRLAVFTKIVCSPANVKIYLNATKGYQACVTWRSHAIAQINALQPALVLITSKVDGEDAVGLSGSESDLDNDWGKALGVSLSKLKASGRRLVYLDDTPTPKEDVPDCLSAHPRDTARCAQTTQLAATTGRRTAMADAARAQGATLISPTPWFCTSTTCPVIVGNILVYRDESHVSGAYIRLIGPLLSEQLRIPKLQNAQPNS